MRFCENCGEHLADDQPHSMAPSTNKHYCFGCEPVGVVVVSVNMETEPPNCGDDYADRAEWHARR